MTTALNIRIPQRPLSRERRSCVQPKPATFGNMDRLVATFAMNPPNQGHGLEHSANAIWEPLRM